MADCKSLLMEVYNTNKIQTDKVYYTQYTLKMIRNGKLEQESNVQMYLNNQQRQIITDQLRLSIDSIYVVTIIPMTKTIVVNYLNPKTREEYKKMTITSPDSIFFNSMKQESCESIVGNTNYTKSIILVAKDSKSATQKVQYLINENKKTIYKMIVYSHDLNSRVEYIYNTINFDYKGKQMNNKSALDIAFNKDGSLLSQYNGYQITDNRKKN